MVGTTKNPRFEKARLIVLPSLLAAVFGFLLSHNSGTQPVHAFSSGPPAGYTAAPGEEPEACAECHVPPDVGTGHLSINAPQTYVPGQTYQITVTHTNSDLTRLRWGFELTALDTSDEKAGNLQSTDGLTQILNNQGPGGSRQYIEHTSAGTFQGQQNGASWTFNWTAPATDVGFIMFYAAGNQANNDGNTSGDHIYKTFVAAVPFASTPDFSIIATPSLRAVIPGASAEYTATITPSAGFSGTVNLSASGLPTGAVASFNPTSVSITDATSKTATLTITTTASTPLGDFPISITGTAGSLVHTSQVTLKMISASSVDLAITKSASPNPGQVNAALNYRITVTNNGPAVATNVMVTDTLPSGVAFGSASTTQGSCGGNGPPVVCSLNSLSAGATAVVTIIVTPSSQGQITNTATASASETDFDSSNNTASINTQIQPAAVSPTMVDPNLAVSTVVTGLAQPTSLAFLGANDFLVLEKASGKVQRIVNGALQSTVLDLPVNSASERGLLGIALHPQFASNGFVYLFWSESNTGLDTSDINAINVLGNRVDRYIWNGSVLTFDRNLIQLRAYQFDGGQARGNHNAGVLRFGPDGKLYILFGDNGRRGFLQNITSGGPVPDDQYGGPEPDDEHMTGVILRLNDDGTTPADNPFFSVNSGLTGEAAANVKKIFAYGVRNSFGMAFDPQKGNLWTQENGDDAFDEINRVRPGFNGGWIQIIGPSSRIAEFKSIETTYGAGTLQQARWPPSNIADTAQQAMARLYMLPGAQYTEPEFSWKYAVAPSPLGFVSGRALGPQFEGDMFVGASRTTLLNGYLFRFRMSPDRLHFAFSDSRLNDLVADNTDKFDLTESDSLVVGRDFGITTDIQTAPNGNVFVVSLSNGAVYEIKAKPSLLFFATLTGSQEVPANSSTATGTAVLQLSPDETTARLSLNFSGLSSPQTDAHIHGPAAAGSTAAVMFPLSNGQLNDFVINLQPAQVQNLKDGLLYVNVHSSTFPSGEIRGQFGPSSTGSSAQFVATHVGIGEGQGSASIVVTRAGDLTQPGTVDYRTTDSDTFTIGCGQISLTAGAAYGRCDFATTVGTLSFAAGESSKSFVVPIIDDSYADGTETFNVVLSNPTGASLGSPSTATVTISDNDATTGPNPIFTTPFFVRLHYLDFLGREPEAGEPYTGILNGCADVNNLDPNSPSANCDRLFVSGQFLGSPEFKFKGGYVIIFYRVAFDRLPTYTEFATDLASVSGATAAEVFAKRAAFANNFVLRSEFAPLAGMTNTDYVHTLMRGLTSITTPDPANPEGATKVTLSETDLVNRLGGIGGTLTRAQVLRAIVQSDEVSLIREPLNVFVASQYYAYLRRSPDASGFTSWINYLTANPNDFRTMVNGFMNSQEYRLRFGPNQ